MEHININDVEILNKLGSGSTGNVYLAKYKDKSYALKIEYIRDNTSETDLGSHLGRELYFIKNFSNKYPDYFIHLLGHDIIDDCKEIRTFRQQDKYSKKYDKFCSRKLYSLVDTTLEKTKPKNLNEIYSMVIQLLNIIKLLQDNMYVHADFNPKNIGIIYTNEKTIKLFGLNIPTYGKLYVGIDFGNVLHKDFLLTNAQKEKYLSKIGREADDIFFGYILSNLLNYRSKKTYGKEYNFDEDYKLFQKSDKYEKISNVTKDKNLQLYLYDTFYHKQHVTDYHGKNAKISHPTFKIPLKDVIHYVLTKRNIEENINYLFNQIT